MNKNESVAKIVAECLIQIDKLRAERDRFLTIAHNAIYLGELDVRYNEDRLLRELGCSQEEYDEIVGRR